MRRTTIGIIVAVLAGLPAAAAAQESAWGTNGYISFNALYQPDSSHYELTTLQDINQETARITTSQEVGHGVLGDVMAGGRVYRNLGVGFGLTFSHANQDADVTGSIPHPFYFDQPRPLTGTTELKRDDLQAHIDAMFLLPITDQFQISVFGGPTWFQIKQKAIQSITVEETFPFDTVGLSGVTLEERKGSTWGFNAGADASVFFTRYIGVQGMVRYVKGTVKVGSDANETSVDVDGIQVGGGLRVRF